jgi:hypothetical protein
MSARTAMSTQTSLGVWAFAFSAAFSGCRETTPEFSSGMPQPDGAMFVAEVYPILLRNCAFSTCHAVPERFLQVYGPGRKRLDPTINYDDDMTLAEVVYSYDRARSMLATTAEPTESLLLRKPLELAAGGQGHFGVDGFGRNVFQSRDDADYQVLLSWAQSSGQPPKEEDVAAAISKAGEEIVDLVTGAL